MTVFNKLERDLGKLFVGSSPTRGRPATKTVAIFPCGSVRDVEDRRRHGGGYRVTSPSGEVYETSLRDLKVFLAGDHPGVKFERRPA